MIMWIFWIINTIIITEVIFFICVKYYSMCFGEAKAHGIFFGVMISLFNNLIFAINNDYLGSYASEMFEGANITITQLVKHDLYAISILSGTALSIYIFIKINKALYKLYGGEE